MADAYDAETLTSIAKVILDRDGNVNVIKASREWREIFPREKYPCSPDTTAWENVFGNMGLVSNTSWE